MFYSGLGRSISGSGPEGETSQENGKELPAYGGFALPSPDGKEDAGGQSEHRHGKEGIQGELS